MSPRTAFPIPLPSTLRPIDCLPFWLQNLDRPPDSQCSLPDLLSHIDFLSWISPITVNSFSVLSKAFFIDTMCSIMQNEELLLYISIFVLLIIFWFRILGTRLFNLINLNTRYAIILFLLFSYSEASIDVMNLTRVKETDCYE